MCGIDNCKYQNYEGDCTWEHGSPYPCDDTGEKESNLVTCGKCGKSFLHKIGLQELTCPFCSFNEDICHFPDYFQ